jgi:ketosteroid isomerase-like protein
MKNTTPDFNKALQDHLDAISNRDIEAFKDHMTRDKTMYTIVQNGHAFTTPEEIIAVHEEWFKDTEWTWKGTIVHTVVGEDMALALIRYDHQPKSEDAPLTSWLTYVFRLENGAWRIVHDQSTSLDFPAFARAAGLAS